MMKREGFTLIELIFTIVIIGVLAATAIPKYQDLRANAEINHLAKIVADVKSSVPSAYYNAVDLNGEDPTNLNSNVRLNSLITINGNDWEYTNTGHYIYKNNILYIGLLPIQRRLTIWMRCDNFPSNALRDKCRIKFPISTQHFDF